MTDPENDRSDDQAYLKAVMDTVLDGLITIDKSGIVKSFNPAAVRIFGYQPEEVIGRNVRMLMPDPYHREHDGYLKNYLETGSAKVIGIGREVEAKRKDGSVFPMELGVNEMYVKGERMFVGTIRNITERKEAEQRLKDNESRLNAILDNTVDGLITIDDRGTIEKYNKACERIFGYTPEEVLGKNIKMLMPEPYHGEHDGYLRNYLDTGKKKIIGIGREVSGKRRDGSVFPIDLSVSEIRIQGRRIYSGIIRDISARKRIEQELLASEQRYDIAVKGMGVGLWDWNILTGEIYWSPTFMDIVGITDRSYEPTLEKFREILHPDDADHTFALLNGHLQRKNPYDVEYRLRHMNGHYIWIRACGLAVWDRDGNPTRMVGSVNDVSDRKRAEEELVRSNMELERFAYVASHDLQEPLRIVANFTSLLESEYRDRMDEQAVGYMRFIIDGARRMQGLVGDLLEYSRIGHEDTGFTVVDCRAQTDIALANLREAIEETKAVVLVNDLPVIHANPVRFSRLMQNLVGNAVKYRAMDRTPRVTVGAADRGDEWLFSVADNGIGMKEEYLDQIFIIFKRLHGRSEYKGTGIGLAVCKKIIESFNGRIWAESKPGEGSVFYFTVPKKDAEKKAA